MFGTLLAESLARALDTDVAYGCVEILPTEFAAQYAGILREHAKSRVILADARAADAVAPFPVHPKGDRGSDIFAGTLDIGASGQEQDGIVAALLGLLDEIARAGGYPRVMVVDSLSDGYNLGALAPRILADELCKMAAERGMILILLEETMEHRHSAWSFATDVVIELGAVLEDSPNDLSHRAARRMVVSKNRLGPSVPGGHSFTIGSARGLRVYPRPWVYESTTAKGILFAGWPKGGPGMQAWGSGWSPPAAWPALRGSVVAVSGPHGVRRAAMSIGDAEEAGVDVRLSFTRAVDDDEPQQGKFVVDCQGPFLSGDWLLAITLDLCNKAIHEGKSIRRVLVGDLQVIRTFRDPDGIRRACMVLARVLREQGVPIILFETGTHPQISDFADVIASPSGGQDIVFHDLRTDVRLQAPFP
ncbi:hypothetical protein [Polyangium sorediatum]|uniref:Uncharacterized protein n=1 Tax=Polyangium sorediatum TaxID=889274 RepID=A0ABT6NRF3_9BACT|nr:hypothetical protein [Polyangium sorediatum]MDI1430890.1 hypothetical protein [Polyangium sorediatum]